jgi:hypothetical protein
MPGPISAFLAEDHARLDRLLGGAFAGGDTVDLAAFGAFREGLLRHIAFEEKILLPAMTRARGGVPVPLARRLRVDHGALAALLVATPTPALAGELGIILGPHNLVEEGEDGLYAACDALLMAEEAGSARRRGEGEARAIEAEALVERMRAYPPVRVARYHDGPRVCRTAEEALRVSALQSGRREGA